ncbi:DUF4330 domain-containing protein [Halorientalis pallida]|uniref:DUF4330 domain-containing protein n=1 Tax=Halorientalis pallida TaxID=2479928 RepID=A0A498KV78_9EURY|nr:DUF4330 domain-containing protein [Halorientalis pallida]RXK47419.1 DUF4330 domain-containing protein [Halorientalis pallida]
MELIDEEGRLFGRVNVVDALVLLVVLAVVGAGVALVTGSSDQAEPGGNGDGGNTETRYATLALGPQSVQSASAIQAGQNVTLAGSSTTVRVTDVHRTGATNGRVQSFLRIAYPAGLPVRGAPIRTGRSVTVVGDGYQTDAAVRSVDHNGSAFQTDTVAVSLTTEVDASTAAAVETGDRLTVGNRTLATVGSVVSIPTNEDERRRLRLGITLATRTVGGESEFADRALRVGSTIPLRTNHVEGLDGTIRAVGSLQPPGDPTDVTMTIAWEGVRPAVATALGPGTTESHRGGTARLVDVTTGPATVVVPTSDGELVVRDHPRDRDVTLTVRATGRASGSAIQFHDGPLTVGRQVTLEFDGVTIHGTLLDFESDE